ncbi:hypothetical protein [Actinomycetospora sp. NBC_00405]|uniref:hypothetical protein n=1 Tax=Actinomycetospora sp. NBC_00405 TaxID=2975952 RepID=UPI002E24D248
MSTVYGPLGERLGALNQVDVAEVDWLHEADPDHGMGYFPAGWPAETWVLHGMWEDPAATDPRDADQQWREDNPDQVGGRLDVGVVVYGSTPFPDPPPPGWRRLRWRELAERLNESLDRPHRAPPSSGWFPIRSWPASIQTPPEGTLDNVCGPRLIDLVAEHTTGGPTTPCFAYYNLLTSPIRMQPSVLTGPLHAILDAAHQCGWTPTNVWPADRSWLITTDYDLWSTRLAGPPELTAALEGDPELETVRHHHP